MSENNGPIIAPPKNIGEMQQLARDLYGAGKKHMAIAALCDCIQLLAGGMRRSILDYEQVKKELAEAIEESNDQKRRIAKLEELQRPK